MAESIPRILAFFFGSFVGSFLNVCIWRLPREESIVFPWSHCTSCNHTLCWYDNIPLLSYILLAGKCRHCNTGISFRYFAVEFMTAFLFAALIWVNGPGVIFLSYACMTCILMISTFTDFSHRIIPDEVSLGGLALGLALSAAYPPLQNAVYEGIWTLTALKVSVFRSAFGAFAGAGTIFAVGFLGKLVFRKDAMGGGDVKLMAMVGAFLGWKLALFTIFAGSLIGSLAGVIVLLKDRTHVIPFGPYLSLGAMVSLFWGEKLIGLYLVLLESGYHS